MSMICNLRQASREDIARLREDPGRIMAFLYGEEVARLASPPAGRLLSRLFGGRKRSPSPQVQWSPRQDGDQVDLEKTWHGLHFLFTGTAWEGKEPASSLLLGGSEIGDVDVGYGPARALRPDEVKRFADYLLSVTPEELKGRYDPERMVALQIYPEVWGADEQEGDPDFDYLLEGFETLRDFVVKARDAGDGVIIYLN
jgi:hypothetical protein